MTNANHGQQSNQLLIMSIDHDSSIFYLIELTIALVCVSMRLNRTKILVRQQRKKMSTKAQNSNLFESISIIIEWYSRMPVKSVLFGNNLALQIVVGLTINDIVEGLDYPLQKHSIDLLSKTRKSKNRRHPLFILISIDHVFCPSAHVSEDKKSILAIILDRIQNCIVMFTDGSITHNILPYPDFKKYKNKTIKAIIVKSDLEAVPQTFNNLSEEIVHSTQNINNNKSKSYGLKSQSIQQLYNQVQQFLVICQIFHSHINLSVCLYSIQQYLTENSHTPTSPLKNIYTKMIQQQIRPQTLNTQSDIIDEELGIGRSDIPDTAQFFVLKQRASKITKQQLMEHQFTELRNYYENNIGLKNFLVLSNKINYMDEQKQFLKNIALQFRELGSLYKVSYGIGSLLLWITYNGLPVLRIPTLRGVYNRATGSHDKNTLLKAIKKISKVLTEQHNNIGYLKFTVKQKYSIKDINKVIQENEEGYDCQFSDSDSINSDKFSIDHHSKEEGDNNSVYIIDLHRAPPQQQSGYYEQYCWEIWKLIGVVCESFIKKINLREREKNELRKMESIERISEILGANSKKSKDCEEIRQILVNRFVYDRL